MKRVVVSAAVIAVAVMGSSEEVSAGPHGLFSGGAYGSAGASFGSYGSGGSYGSVAANYGSHGSSGSSGSSGGLTRRESRLIYRAERRSASSGSSGSSYGSVGSSHGSTGASHGAYGSTGGSYGSTGHVPNRVLRRASRYPDSASSGSASSGSSGSYGSASHGSSSYGSAAHGHSSYFAPVANYGTSYVANLLSTSGRTISGAGYSTPSSTSRVAPVSYAVQAEPEVSYAYVVVQLPTDAVLYLGGNKTSTKGGLRKFKIPVTDASRSYPYAIKAELVRDGQVYVATSTETLVAGQTVNVKVNDIDVAVAAR